jgi:uncharacterized membrane protein
MKKPSTAASDQPGLMEPARDHTGAPAPAEGQSAAQQASAIETYSYVCGTALIMIGLILFRRGLFPLALFPVGAGFLGLFFRWRIAPILVIAITGSCLVRADRGDSLNLVGQQVVPGAIVDLQTWIICSALLAYVLAHYRLQSLTAGIFPADRRPTGQRKHRNPIERPRSGRTVGTSEAVLLILTLPFVTFAALILLRTLPNTRGEFEFRANTWLTVMLLWILGSIVGLTQAALGYVGLRNLTFAEARLYLQDLLWLDLRRDLRRINRWLVWSRSRKDR